MKSIGTETADREALVDAAIAEYLIAKQNRQPFDRAAWLDRHTEFARELGDFLADEEHVGGILAPLKETNTAYKSPDADTYSYAMGNTPRPIEHGFAGPLSLPASMGDYELLEEIARGGMGVVFKAWQKSLKRPVALKMVLGSRLASAKDVERFQREAEAAAGLDHPNIVPIHEVGQIDGLPFFSMKLIEGGSLADRRAEFLASPRKAAVLMATVARAVHHAHQRGILHRDLKPSNVLLDANGEPHVADFGLAKRLEVDEGDGYAQTRTGAVVGTASYMSPEQARGEASKLTTASDVYGLGAVLYELLAGQPPFLASSQTETLLLVLNQEPVRPSQIRPGVPRDLETICLKCLSKQSAKRYASAEALAEDLERWLKGEPIEARAAGRIERTAKWVQRNPTAAGLCAVSMLALLALAGVIVGLIYNDRLQSSKNNVEAANQQLKSIADDLEKEKIRADQLRTIADEERGRALEQEKLAQRYLYNTNMNQAQKAWEEKKYGLGLQLLTKLIPVRADQEDLRGPEWHHFWRQCGGADSILRGHKAAVTCTAYSPSGKILASGDAKGTIKLWDVKQEREIRSFRPHGDVVSAIAFDSTGKRFASVSHDGSLGVWDIATGSELATKKAGGEMFLCLAFDDACQMLATGDDNGSVKLWNVRGGARIRTCIETGSRVHAVAFQKGGKSVVALTDTKVHVGNVAFGPHDMVQKATALVGLFVSPVGSMFGVVASVTSQSFSLNRKRVTCLALSPDGQNFAVGSFWTYGSFPPKAVIELCALRSGEVVSSIEVGREPVLSVIFSADSKQLAVSISGSEVNVLDVAKGVKSSSFHETTNINSLCFSPDRKKIITGTEDQMIRVRTLRDEVVLRGAFANVVYSRDGRFLAAGGSNSVLKTGAASELETKIPRFVDYFQARVTITGSGEFVSDGMRLVNLQSGIAMTLPRGGTRMSLGKSFSPDGSLFAETGRPLGTRVFSVKPFQLRRELTKPAVRNGIKTPTLGEFGSSIAFSHDGKFVATGHGVTAFREFAGEVQIWDVATNQLLIVFNRHCYGVWDLAFSPDDRYLAGACGVHTGGVGEVKLWEVSTGREVATLGGYSDCVWSVAFSSDGKRLATGSGPYQTNQDVSHFRRPRGEIRIWDHISGQEIISWKQPHTVYGVAYSPDGKELAFVGSERVCRFWGLPSGEVKLRSVAQNTQLESQALVP